MDEIQNKEATWSSPSLEEIFPRTLGHLLAKVTVTLWRWSNDRQALTSFVGRYSAHLAILTLAFGIVLSGRISLSPDEISTAPVFQVPSRQAAADPVATATPAMSVRSMVRPLSVQASNVVARQAQPHTDIPERVRLHVITYTVQSGDSIFTIAERFKLSPYTIAWSNMETLQGSPWLLQPGLTLFIPPVDGVYHAVKDGETPESIAQDYDVSASALYNQWNDLQPGQQLRAGMLLVIPGGTGDDVEWNPPPPPPSRPGVGAAAASWGACGDTSVSGPGANGWFILPTGSRAVSGWYFHDPGNPGHIGLDYRCYLGDPIYASDNGVVVFSGWGGGYGNLVRVNHGNGYQTYYAHLDSIAVSCGQAVYQGQIIGYCGTTGWSTGPHLHYEIRLNGVPQNPQLYEP